MRERKLTNPPRTLGAKARSKPITPQMIAMTASTTPVAGLTKKLATAAARAMIEGILKWGLFLICATAVFIFYVDLSTFSGWTGENVFFHSRLSIQAARRNIRAAILAATRPKMPVRTGWPMALASQGWDWTWSWRTSG